MARKTAGRASNYVRGETNTLELATVGHAINLRVYRRGGLKGRLLVGRGSLRWIPRGKKKSRGKTIPWDVFVEMMKEWPFGSRIRARLKFMKGALRWRGPNKGGRGRKVTWEEFVVRMDTPLTPRQKTKIAKLEREHRERRKAKKRAGTRTTKKREKATASGKKSELERPPWPPVGGGVLIPGIRPAMTRKAYVSYPAHNGDVVRLKRPRARGTAGPIDVWINDRREGQIDRHGYYRYIKADEKRVARVVRDLESFVAHPEKWIKHATEKEGICVVCGRRLTNPKSVALAMGPVCRTYYYGESYSGSGPARRQSSAAGKRSGRRAPQKRARSRATGGARRRAPRTSALTVH